MSVQKQTIKNALLAQGFMPIYVKDDLDSKLIVEAAIEGGCKVLEYTCRRMDARQMIPWTKKTFPHIAVLGATLIDGARTAAGLRKSRPNFMGVDEMADLGVDGLVSFLHFRPETYAKYAQRLIMIPGVASANEGLDQLELGADFLKYLVGSPSGTETVKGLKAGTHGGFPVMVSGGVTAARIPELVGFGAVLATAGFDLLLKAEIASGQKVTHQRVVQVIREHIAAVNDARRQHHPKLQQAIEAANANPLEAAGFVA